MQRRTRSAYIPFCFVLIVALFTVFLLYYNQVVVRIKRADDFFANSRAVNRGDIFATDKHDADQLLASTHVGYNLVVSPFEIGDVEEIYEHINEEINIEKEDFFAKARKEGEDYYELIKKDISRSEEERLRKRIANYNLKGVYLESFKKRIYFHDSFAAHVIGFVSEDSNTEVRGRYGIENSFNDILSISEEHDDNSAQEDHLSGYAGNVFLTIDIDVQRKVEAVLRDLQEQWNFEEAGGIVMDPHTGSIIAMAANPTFNLNMFNKVTDHTLFGNINLESVYEMGSVFKPITAAIALDSGRVQPTDTYNDSGRVVIDGRPISNYDGKGRGPDVPIKTILSHSLNTGAVFLLQKTTIGIFKEYMSAFRFGDLTRIELPKEISGLIGNFSSNREIEFATASFGQGFAVTPIAAIKAFASLANGGIIVQPYVVSRFEWVTDEGVVVEPSREDARERRRIFRSETTDLITDYLVDSYDTVLLNGRLRNDQYSVAAKTGTAQLPNPETGKYADDKFLHSFFGYFPARNPSYIIFLFTVNPKDATFASETLAIPFNELFEFIIGHYAIPSDR